MPKVKLPDGRILNVPEGTSPEKLQLIKQKLNGLKTKIEPIQSVLPENRKEPESWIRPTTPQMATSELPPMQEIKPVSAREIQRMPQSFEAGPVDKAFDTVANAASVPTRLAGVAVNELQSKFAGTPSRLQLAPEGNLLSDILGQTAQAPDAITAGIEGYTEHIPQGMSRLLGGAGLDLSKPGGLAGLDEAGTKSWEEAHPVLGRADAAAKPILHLLTMLAAPMGAAKGGAIGAGGLALDPTLGMLGGASRTAQQGKQMKQFADLGMAPANAPKLIAQGKAAEVGGRTVAAAFAPGMAESAVHEGKEFLKEDDWTSPAAIRHGLSATESAVFAGLAGSHTLGKGPKARVDETRLKALKVALEHTKDIEKKGLPGVPEQKAGAEYSVYTLTKSGDKVKRKTFTDRKDAEAEVERQVEFNESMSPAGKNEVHVGVRPKGMRSWKVEGAQDVHIKELEKTASFQEYMDWQDQVVTGFRDLVFTDFFEPSQPGTQKFGAMADLPPTEPLRAGLTAAYGGRGRYADASMTGRSGIRFSPQALAGNIADRVKEGGFTYIPQLQDLSEHQRHLDMLHEMTSTAAHEVVHQFGNYKHEANQKSGGISPELEAKFAKDMLPASPYTAEGQYMPGRLGEGLQAPRHLTRNQAGYPLKRGEEITRRGGYLTAQQRFDILNHALRVSGGTIYDTYSRPRGAKTPEPHVLKRWYEEFTKVDEDVSGALISGGAKPYKPGPDVGAYKFGRSPSGYLRGQSLLDRDYKGVGKGKQDSTTDLADSGVKNVLKALKTHKPGDQTKAQQILGSRREALGIDRDTAKTRGEREAIDEQIRGLEARADKIKKSGKGKKTSDKTPPPMLDRQGWVYGRQAISLRVEKVREMFKGLRNQPFVDAVKGFQKGGKGFEPLRQYFEKRYQDLKDAGKDIEHRENYLPQLWKNTAEEIADVFPQRRLGLKPTFAYERIFETYEEGIKAGLKPKFTNLADLAAWYEGVAQKAVVDQKFFNYSKFRGHHKPEKFAPRHWERYAKGFPLTGKGEVFAGPPDVVKKVNNYLAKPFVPLKTVADFSSWVKNIMISSGIPKTAINFHAFSTVFRRGITEGKGKYVKGMVDMLRPARAHERIWKNLDGAIEAVEKGGLTLTAEEHAFSPELKASLGKRLKDVFKEEPTNELLKKMYPHIGPIGRKTVGSLKAVNEFHKTVFDEPLFQMVLPAWKLEHYKYILKELESNMPETPGSVQHRLAGRLTNDRFGGINWDGLGRDKNLHNFVRMTIFAPDFLETQLHLGKGVAKSLFDPTSTEGKAYRQVTQNMLYLYVSMSIANKLTSGHWIHENQPGHQFSIDLGSTTTDDGRKRKRYFKILGTGADFLRLPIESAEGIIRGDVSPLNKIFKNRLAAPLHAGIKLGMNTDYAGRPLYAENIAGTQQTRNLAGPVVDLFMPQYGEAAISQMQGRSTPEITLAKSIELPLSYPSLDPNWQRGKRGAGWFKKPKGGFLTGLSGLRGLAPLK